MSHTVAFSGTRSELTQDEQFRIAGIIHYLPEGTRIVTGACVGVDAFVAAFAHMEGRHVHTIVPADRSRVDRGWRKHCTTFREMPPGSTYRDRNVAIVAELTEPTDRLIAIAAHDEQEPESRRSGTWQTYRSAQKAGHRTTAYVLCAACDPERRAVQREEPS